MKREVYAMGQIGGKRVVPRFEEEKMSAEGCLNLISEADRRTGMLRRIASKIKDERVQGRVKHSFLDILRTRVFGICSGNFACSDVDKKKSDYIFKMALGRDPEDESPLPSLSSYCRFENNFNLSPKEVEKVGESIIESFCDHAYEGKEPESMCIDVDETFVELYGNQSEIRYNKHYLGKSILPMKFFDFATKWCLKSIFRPAKTPTGEESSNNIADVVNEVRKGFKNTRILIRGDGHYCTKEVVLWCLQQQNTEYIFGLPQNNILNQHTNVKRNEANAIAAAKQNKEEEKEPTATTYSILRYAPKQWGCKPQRVIVRSIATERNGEYIAKSRYVMTSIKGGSAEEIYKDYYSPRGQAENFIKEHKIQLYSDRTSCNHETANQMRLHIHTMAHNLFCLLRGGIPKEFHLRKAEIRTLQKELIRVPVKISKTKTRIILTYPKNYKHKNLYLIILNNLRVNLRRRNKYP